MLRSSRRDWCAIGRRLLSHLRDAGVDARHARIDPGAGFGMSVAIIDAEGDYGAVIVSGANLRLGQEDLEEARPEVNFYSGYHPAPPHKSKGVIPLACGGKFSWMTMRTTDFFIEHFAGPAVHDQLFALEGPYNSPAVIQAFAKLKEWVTKGYFNEGFISLDPDQALPQEIVNAFFQAQDSVVLGTLTPEAAAVQIQKAIEAYKGARK